MEDKGFCVAHEGHDYVPGLDAELVKVMVVIFHVIPLGL